MKIFLSRGINVPVVILFLVSLGGLFTGCEPDNPSGIYDPDEDGRPAPEITSVEPAEGTFAGIGIVTIRGQNFSNVGGENLVYFNDQAGDVLSASSDMLSVRVPDVVDDSTRIKVAVIGAFLPGEWWP